MCLRACHQQPIRKGGAVAREGERSLGNGEAATSSRQQNMLHLACGSYKLRGAPFLLISLRTLSFLQTLQRLIKVQMVLLPGHSPAPVVHLIVPARWAPTCSSEQGGASEEAWVMVQCACTS